MLDLNPIYLEQIKKFLFEQIPNKEVWAYGSRVINKAHAGSDLDLVIFNLKNPSPPEENLMHIGEIFRESNSPILINIHDWATIPEDFKQEIHDHHIKIQAASSSKNKRP